MYEQKREKDRKLDQRDAQLFKMRDVNSSLRDLAKNKQLGQREKLRTSLDTTQDMLSAREDEVKASRVGRMWPERWVNHSKPGIGNCDSFNQEI